MLDDTEERSDRAALIERERLRRVIRAYEHAQAQPAPNARLITRSSSGSRWDLGALMRSSAPGPWFVDDAVRRQIQVRRRAAATGGGLSHPNPELVEKLKKINKLLSM